MSDEQISALRNAHIGYVPQHAGLVPTLTILDNIRLPWHLANRRGLNPQAALKSSLLPWVLLIWADSILERFPAESFVERRLPERS